MQASPDRYMVLGWAQACNHGISGEFSFQNLHISTWTVQSTSTLCVRLKHIDKTVWYHPFLRSESESTRKIGSRGGSNYVCILNYACIPNYAYLSMYAYVCMHKLILLILIDLFRHKIDPRIDWWRLFELKTKR